MKPKTEKPVLLADAPDPVCSAKLHRIHYTSLVNSFIETSRPGSAGALDEEIEPYFAGDWPAPFAAQAILSDRIVDPVRRRVPWWQIAREWVVEPELRKQGRA